MLKGNNEMSINQATMLEAIQLWIDDTFKDPTPRVTHVKIDSSVQGGFILMFTDAEKTTP